MVADYDTHLKRKYIRKAHEVQQNITTGHYSSLDLIHSSYSERCPYFPSCARGSSVSTNSSLCPGEDSFFSFEGRVGVVTTVVESDTAPAVWVTFNGGRTSYFFLQEHIQLEYRQRSMYGKIV
jgi:hypothetical protein